MDAIDREFEPNLDDEREVDLVDDIELPAPPATVDPDERVEEPTDDAEHDDVPLDDDRPV